MSKSVSFLGRPRASVQARAKIRFYYALLAPAMLLLVVFMAYPFVDNIRISLLEWDALTAPRWRGLGNYVDALRDPVFYRALWHTLVYSAGGTTATVALGFLVAVGISRRVFGWRIFRFGYFIPVMLAATVTAALWAQLYEYNTGIINEIRERIGLSAIAWLGDRRYSLVSVMLVSVWGFLGFPMIVILAGLEDIPPDLQDAATIDGTNELQRMIHVSLPLLRPVLISLTMLLVVISLRVFDIVFIMTRGGPSNSSEVLVTFLYKKGFQNYGFGFASAVAILMFVLVFGVAYWYHRAINRSNVQY